MTAFLDFPSVSPEEWHDKIVADLKGRSFDTLIAQTDEGIDIRPFYTDSDHTKSAFPARDTAWRMHQDFSADSDEANNVLVLEALQAGVASVGIGETEDLDHLRRILNEVYVEMVDLFIPTSNPSQTFGQLTELFYEKGRSFSEMSGGILYDPFGRLLHTGSWYDSKENDLDGLRAHYGRCAPHDRLCASLINGAQIANAGADHVTELALVLSQLNEYIEQCKGTVSLDLLVKKMCIILSVDTDFYLSASKIAAFRCLWSNLLKGHGIADTSCEIMAKSSAWDLAPVDRHSNILRLTTMAMAAAMGGCDRLDLPPFDGECTAFSMRMSRNIQLLMVNESHLDKNVDPLRGAHLFEAASRQMAEAAWEQFKQIESSGGFLVNVMNGSIQKDIRATAESRVKKRNDGERPWLGVNLYPEIAKTPQLQMELTEGAKGVTTGLAFPQKTAAL